MRSVGAALAFLVLACDAGSPEADVPSGSILRDGTVEVSEPVSGEVAGEVTQQVQGEDFGEFPLPLAELSVPSIGDLVSEGSIEVEALPVAEIVNTSGGSITVEPRWFSSSQTQHPVLEPVVLAPGESTTLTPPVDVLSDAAAQPELPSLIRLSVQTVADTGRRHLLIADAFFLDPGPPTRLLSAEYYAENVVPLHEVDVPGSEYNGTTVVSVASAASKRRSFEEVGWDELQQKYGADDSEDGDTEGMLE